MTKTRASFLTVTLLALASVGCAGGAGHLSPVGPSSISEPQATPATTGAAAWATARGWSTMADGRVAVADGLFVEGVDVIGEVTGTCPDRTFTVRGVPVAVNASTSFAAPLTCEGLVSGRSVKVTGLLSYTTSGISVLATQVAAVSGEDGGSASGGGERLGGAGVVTAADGRCPTVTFAISGYRVQTSEATRYQGGRCEDLQEGVQISLAVERRPDGMIVAEKIAF